MPATDRRALADHRMLIDRILVAQGFDLVNAPREVVESICDLVREAAQVVPAELRPDAAVYWE